MLHDEPINPCLDLSVEENLPVLEDRKSLMFADCVRDISCCAVNEKGEIVGGFFFVDLYMEETQLSGKHSENAKMKIIEEAMDSIHAQYRSFRFKKNLPLRKNRVLKIVMRGVSQKYRRQRLASRALDRAIALARQRGYSYLISETSSAYTKQTFLNRGGISRGNLFYSSWSDSSGIVRFADAEPPHESLDLMEIQL